MLAHQPLDLSAANPMAFCLQGGMDTRAAIATLMLTMTTLNSLQEASLGCRPRALRPGSPGLIGAGRALEHAAHEPPRGRIMIAANGSAGCARPT
jgi:hypothetical protein